MSNVPGVWETLLLVAAVYRVWRLLAFDMVTDGLRDWVFDPLSSGMVKRGYRLLLFVQCPWCFGFWLAVVSWLLWLWWPHAVMVACVPFALSTGVGLIPRNLDP